MRYIDFGEKRFLKQVSRVVLPENVLRELHKKVQENNSQMIEQYIQKHIIFSYRLFDAWFHELCRTDLICGQHHQAVCYHHSEASEICVDIDQAVVDSYVDSYHEIIERYADTFNEEHFCPDEDEYLDGYEHHIFLSSKDCGYYFPCSNLDFHRDGHYSQDEILLSALDEIFALLKAAGIDERYYMLRRFV